MRIMAKLNNPFVIYGYKGAEYFCDREKETAKIMSALHGEQNITLVAPRRMGKTGLIHHVFDRISQEDKNTKCFYIDLYPTKNLTQLVQLMAQEIIGKLDTVSQSTLRHIQAFFNSFRPKVTINELTGAPIFTLDIQPSEEKASLERIFQYMKESGRRCYVALDEFQQILSYSDSGTEALIRSHIQFLDNVYFIFSGSRQHMMEEMFMSANRPFFQSSMIMSLKSIDKAAYLDFANRLIKEQQRQIAPDVFDYIYELCEGVTWYIQAVLHSIYEHRDDVINYDLVDTVVGEQIEEQSPAYQNYIYWITENQQALLYAIAKKGIVKAPLSQKFIRAHNLPAPSSVKTALKALSDKQLISHSPKGYSVSDIFFSLWLKKDKAK